MNKRIAVYVCQCGSNISDYVDVEKVKDVALKEEGVVLAKTTMFACSDSAQSEIVDDIKENNIDGLVIASCSPKLHLFTFRNVAKRANLNPYNYVQANIREQGSWAHANKPKDATNNAIRTVKAAIAKVRLSKPLTKPKISAENAILIIGAGIAGMRAAIELSDMGSKVYLIEKSHFTGGRVPQWGDIFTTDETGEQIVKNLYNEINKRDNISLYTGAELVSTSGSVGNFKIDVRIRPRYLKPESEIKNIKEFRERVNKAIEICPEEVPDEFDFGLTKRKALYLNHKGQFPELPAVDDNACSNCKKCLEICPEIDLNQKEETISLEVGSIILSTGFNPYEPDKGEFGYKQIDNVITLHEFRRLMELNNNNNKLTYNNQEIKNIGYIYCVGSRQIEGENKYCSRYCCASAIHTAIVAKKRYQNIRNFHFHRGIRSYGKLETLYNESSTNGDLYFQSPDDELPEVKKENGKTTVKIKDILTLNREINVDTDLVVLVTGMEPRDNKELINILKVPIGRDNFFNEIHPKLRPVEIVIDGIFIAGTCHSPKNVTETMNSSLSASIKANSLISKGEIELEPTLAQIDKKICEWCEICSNVCPFDAIFKTEKNGKTVATVSKAVCKGCGMCLPVCPVNAIQLVGYSDVEIESMIDALAE